MARKKLQWKKLRLEFAIRNDINQKVLLRSTKQFVESCSVGDKFFPITGKVEALAPTELMQLVLSRGYEGDDHGTPRKVTAVKGTGQRG